MSSHIPLDECLRWGADGWIEEWPGQGREKATTPKKDRHFKINPRRHRNMTAKELAQDFPTASTTNF
ncbi:hypothetical protein TNCV_3031441 [Trichonephila clavipes]|nr:hypothetical protein TNCV_3031441 [Trichonephila clavipes]